MKTTDQAFPDEIISLLLHKKWEDLTKSERELVQQYFAPEEYETLYKAMQVKQEVSPKEKLLQAFDAHHHSGIRGYSNTFKLAAMLLLFGVVALQALILLQHKNSRLVTQLIRDTVWIQPTSVTPTNDTVYLVQDEVGPQSVKHSKTPQRSLSKKKQEATYPLQPDVHIITLEALNDPLYARRKNSIKSDSVYQRLSFVTL